MWFIRSSFRASTSRAERFETGMSGGIASVEAGRTERTSGTAASDRFLGIPVKPLTRRRIANFKANRRGYWSPWIFLALSVLSLFPDFIANDQPLLPPSPGQFH